MPAVNQAILSSSVLSGASKFLNGFVGSLGLVDILIYGSLAFTFLGIQLVGLAGHKSFVKKRKRAFYLEKIDETGSYEGYV